MTHKYSHDGITRSSNNIAILCKMIAKCYHLVLYFTTPTSKHQLKFVGSVTGTYQNNFHQRKIVLKKLEQKYGTYVDHTQKKLLLSLPPFAIVI